MTPKRKTSSEQSSQSARFIEAAKKAGADESGKDFERVLRKIARVPRAPKTSPK